MYSPRYARHRLHEVLISQGRCAGDPPWRQVMDNTLRPTGLCLVWAHSSAETILRIERGGLAAAVVMADEREIDGLSLLRIIRSIDMELPCWLVTRDLGRTTLETASALRVTSVLAPPLEAGDLARALRKVLREQRITPPAPETGGGATKD